MFADFDMIEVHLFFQLYTFIDYKPCVFLANKCLQTCVQNVQTSLYTFTYRGRRDLL